MGWILRWRRSRKWESRIAKIFYFNRDRLRLGRDRISESQMPIGSSSGAESLMALMVARQLRSLDVVARPGPKIEVRLSPRCDVHVVQGVCG